MSSSHGEHVAADLGASKTSQRPGWLAVTRGYGLRSYNTINKRLARVMLAKMAARSPHRLRFESVGEGEGAWFVPTTLLKRNGIAYCVGVGTNASFDEKLAADHGMRVYSIDPTPIAVRYMDNLERDRDRHKFLPVGLWKADTILRLYAPMSASANLSAHDIHATGRYIELPVRTLRSLMNEQKHGWLDLLKIDIEGSWFEVIDDICKNDVPISILCVEFDSPTSPRKALRALAMLRARGFDLVRADRENLILIKRDLLTDR